jgi:hypothetical protein
LDRRKFLSFGMLGACSLSFGNAFKKEPLKDIYLEGKMYDALYALRSRLKKVQRYVGYGTFNYISMDKVLFYARNVASIGAFTKEELFLIEMFFYEDPKKYGFYGKKTIDSLTTVIKEKDIVKIAGTGHYLFKGKPLEDYDRLLKDVGHDITLTSGIRSVPKQMYLYVNKILQLQGNISAAAKIIAPPRYTYHAISDFDVGKKGFGVANFSEKFTTTQEYKELIKLDYVSIRYVKNNKDGVRYEPWHIEVI